MRSPNSAEPAACARYGASTQSIGERLPFDILHHEIVDAIVLADIEYRTDVRVTQAGECLRFAFESGLQVRLIREVLGQDLDRDGPVEPFVASLIHLAHAPGAYWRQDAIGAQFCSGGERHVVP